MYTNNNSYNIIHVKFFYNTKNNIPINFVKD